MRRILSKRPLTTEILWESVIHFSFDMIRTSASFSDPTNSVEIQIKHCLKLPKISELCLLRVAKVYYNRSSSHGGLIMAPGQEANGDNLGKSFPSSIQ